MSSPKRIALIGHRGVGKTSLLSRIERAYRSVGRRARIFDLDKEIEQAAGRSVSQIFQEDGEAVFRRFEQTTFDKIDKEVSRTTDDVYLALGAGFNVMQIPSKWKALWIRRVTDRTGRIFTDRPRLESKVSPLEEFRIRFDARDPKFKERADSVLIVDEGIEDADDAIERDYFTRPFESIGGSLTLMPENFSRDFESWAHERSAWGVRWFELRDDLLSEEQMARAAKVCPANSLLVSFRSSTREASTRAFLQSQASALAFDWPIERGACDLPRPLYFSLHERTGSLIEALSRIESAGEAGGGAGAGAGAGAQLKAALPTHSFEDLIEGHRWQQIDPARRIFLPMSDDGRWAWYRLLQSEAYSLNFFRESSGSASDQPTLLQWIRHRRLAQSVRAGISLPFDQQIFAAILGDPVLHSRTPLEQASFFSRWGLDVLAIRVTESEWSVAIPFLASLGLRAAAVTSPLKRIAFDETKRRSGLLSEKAKRLESINTLTFDENGVIAGTNTDVIGLKKVASLFSKEFAHAKAIGVWGGGGTLGAIREAFPGAIFYSARTGKIRDDCSPSRSTPQPPDALIWAAQANQSSPPPDWAPKIVFDLNYSDSSFAREYALAKNAVYISGLAMFRAQASAQREFWSQSKQGVDT